MPPGADAHRDSATYGGSMSRITREERQRRIDAVVGISLAALLVAGTLAWIRLTPGTQPLSPLGLALLLASTLPLAVRGRYPVAVLATVMTAVTAYTWLEEPGHFFWVGSVFAIWGAVAAGHRLAAIVTGGVFLAVGTIVWGSLSGGDPDAPIWLAGWLVASGGLGAVSGSRGETLEQMEQGALDAERTREEEALRRAGEERLRIARELHDVLAHDISVINVQAGVAVHLMDRQPEQARIALDAISQASRDAM